MSEGKSRFKIKKGDVEIEFEGDPKEVSEKYQHVFEWIKSLPIVTPEVRPVEEERKEEKRGGPRRAIWSPAISELIGEGFFALPNKRGTRDVMKGLHDKGLPVTGKEAQIVTALKRKLRKGELKGTKVEKEWYFWTEEL